MAILALFVFVAIWAGGLVLAGMVAAWRQAAWTVDAVRRGHRTFGGSPVGPSGGLDCRRGVGHAVAAPVLAPGVDSR